MDKTPQRHFSISFDEVLTKAQSMQPQFANDLPLFTSLNPWFTEKVNNQLGINISAGISDFSASSHTAQIERLTETISQMLASAGRIYQKLMYYVENGLGNSKAINDTFGHSRYEKARQSEKEMVSLLKQASIAIGYDDNSTRLIAAGMPENLQEELSTLANGLAEADGQQEMLKKQQLLVTSERIGLFNSIWDTMSKINAAAKILFAEDPARLGIYQLYDSASSKPVEQATPQT